jgi:Ni/Co efflux regulator RcnB
MMNTSLHSRFSPLPLVLMAALMAGSAWAEKPEWAGQGKGGKHEQKDKHGDKHGGSQGGGKKDAAVRVAPAQISIGGYFGAPQRVAVQDYYGQQFRAGKCPPGLAKKNNGCLPPGQAKKWAVGQPLPSDVRYYPVPQPVLLQLGAPPAGHKYVRVAADILLIAVGTGMIVDAIQDLGRM